MHARGGVRPVLVNLHEAAVDHLLAGIAAGNGDRLLTKVRLADAVDLDGMAGLDHRTKNYALKAHLDFLMVEEGSEALPRFAVEFDGAAHFTDPATRDRDRMKDEVCERAGLPLLRISNEYTRRQGRWRVLEYVVGAFYLAEAFEAAQTAGSIPWDEPFDRGNFLHTDQSGQVRFDTLDEGARRRLFAHHRAGRLPRPVPDVWCITVPDERAVIAYALLGVAPDRYLIGRAKIRDFRFRGLGPGELADSLAVNEVAWMADEWITGQDSPVAADGRQLRKIVAEVQSAIDRGEFLSAFTGGGLAGGGGITGPVMRLRSAKQPSGLGEQLAGD